MRFNPANSAVDIRPGAPNRCMADRLRQMEGVYMAREHERQRQGVLLLRDGRLQHPNEADRLGIRRLGRRVRGLLELGVARLLQFRGHFQRLLVARDLPGVHLEEGDGGLVLVEKRIRYVLGRCAYGMCAR